LKRRGKLFRRFQASAAGFFLLAAIVAMLLPDSAVAQTQTLLIEPELPHDFDRGRNVSVQQQKRPGYDPIPVRLGKLEIFPTIEIGVGASDNIYAVPTDRTAAAFLRIGPSVRLSGDYYPLKVKLLADVDLRRFIGKSPRNETNWRVEPSAELSLSYDYKIRIDLRAMQQAEGPTAGEVDPNIAVLSRYTNFYGRLRGEYESGQVRATIAIDDSLFNFSPIDQGNGLRRSQAERDRNVFRITGQAKYALSPSLSGYAQINYGDTNYRSALASGLPNRNSVGWRASAGVNFDLSRLVRGLIGVGYSWRNFQSPLYEDVRGISAEARIEYFPTELTTVALTFRRSLQDSAIGSSQAFFDNRFSARIDHALLRNLILTIDGQYSLQNYIGLESSAKTFVVGFAANYYVSDNAAVKISTQYLSRSRSSAALSSRYSEFNGYVALVIQP
jgi:hypothetical protein